MDRGRRIGEEETKRETGRPVEDESWSLKTAVITHTHTHAHTCTHLLGIGGETSQHQLPLQMSHDASVCETLHAPNQRPLRTTEFVVFMPPPALRTTRLLPPLLYHEPCQRAVVKADTGRLPVDC